MQLLEQSPDPKVGRDYTLSRFVGSIGSTEVYEATSPLYPGTLALKLFRGTSHELSDAFVARAALLRHLGHPMLVPVVDIGRHAGAPFLVMPKAERSLLGQQLSNERLIPLCIELLGVLDFLHSQGVVHGQMTADNLLEFGEEILLGDMGVGLPINPLPTPARRPRDDLMLLGATVAELLTGLPYRQNSLGWGLDDLPGPWRPVLARALTPQRRDAYRDARDMSKAIQALAAG